MKYVIKFIAAIIFAVGTLSFMWLSMDIISGIRAGMKLSPEFRATYDMGALILSICFMLASGFCFILIGTKTVFFTIKDETEDNTKS